MTIKADVAGTLLESQRDKRKPSVSRKDVKSQIIMIGRLGRESMRRQGM